MDVGEKLARALFRNRVRVYPGGAWLPSARRAATDSGIAVVMRDQSQAPQIRQALGGHRHTTVVVDPGRWRHEIGTQKRSLALPGRGLTAMDLATWATTYRRATSPDAVSSPSF